MKIAILGCGLRTPLLLSALLKTGKVPEEIALFDLDPAHASLMANLGRASMPYGPSLLRVSTTAEDAIDSAAFVICSIRPGGMAARARDERIALEMGYAGQETIGPAGSAMAWRTIPAVLDYVRIMERLAPQAWLVNFTNPAGLVTQAVRDVSTIRSVGICDTPAELFLQIARAFGTGLENVECEYFGLNHLGFVRKVLVHGVDRTQQLLNDDHLLNGLYPAPLFPPELLRHMQLIPSEYGFFYFRSDLARKNQLRVGQTRGEELLRMNADLFKNLSAVIETEGSLAGLRVYENYLNHRNSSYFQLEGGGTSAFGNEIPDWNPFDATTGYHRIAVQTIQGLCGASPTSLVLNVSNNGTLSNFATDDVVELNCSIVNGKIVRLPQDPVPPSVFSLLESTKAYERTLVKASIERDHSLLTWALTQHPLIRDWDAAANLVRKLF